MPKWLDFGGPRHMAWNPHLTKYTCVMSGALSLNLGSRLMVPTSASMDLVSVQHTAQPSSAPQLKCHLPLKPSEISLLLPRVPGPSLSGQVFQPTLCSNVHFRAPHLLGLRITHHRSFQDFITPNSPPRPGAVQGQRERPCHHI